MWAARYWSGASGYWTASYWPKVGADDTSPPVTGGPVWIWANGVAIPPDKQTQGTQDTYWLWVNGTVIKPVNPTWPRFPKSDLRKPH